MSKIINKDFKVGVIKFQVRDCVTAKKALGRGVVKFLPYTDYKGELRGHHIENTADAVIWIDEHFDFVLLPFDTIIITETSKDL